jgi:phospholipase/lecithinase/hemolysin
VTFSAHAYTNLVAYGDSLSDDGNTGLFPLGDGISRFTDQAVWVELLADAKGSKLYDGAFGGATTGWDNPAVGSEELGLQWQIGAFQTYFSYSLDMNDTLFTVWAGANDFFQGRDFGQAATNVGAALKFLAAGGAQDILVPNLPDLGHTPAFYKDQNPDGVLEATASGWSLAFNAALESELADFQRCHSDIDIYYLDVETIFEELLEYDDQGNIINFDELFWDPVHPTIVGHENIANGAAQVIDAVPVPASLVLLGTGILGLSAFRRRLDS